MKRMVVKVETDMTPDGHVHPKVVHTKGGRKLPITHVNGKPSIRGFRDLGAQGICFECEIEGQTVFLVFDQNCSPDDDRFFIGQWIMGV